MFFFQDRVSLNVYQKYCREHSAIFSTFIKLPVLIKTSVFSIFNDRFTQVLLYFKMFLIKNKKIYGPVHEISNNVVCATSTASDQPAHTRSLIRAFASRLNIL